MESVWYLFLVILVIAVLIAARVYSDRLDRRRICEHVAGHGGKVLNISWNPLGGSWSRTLRGRFYDVRYSTHRGKLVTATCVTSAFNDVSWLRDTPPGFADEGEAANADEEEVHQASAAPAEPIACLACGTRIPARASRCPKCGWSYQSRPTS